MDAACPRAGPPGRPRFSPDDKPVATRKASSDVIQWAAAQVPTLVSGSADLEPSTLTLIEGGGAVERATTPAGTCTTACASTAWARW